jgi:hypothetical protein
MEKKFNDITYTTIVDQNYIPLLDKLIQTHQKFSNINLMIFTINFEITDVSYKNIEFVKYNDEILEGYMNNQYNSFIKNDREKHKYTTTLKPKILKNYLDKFKYFFFIDCDVIFTKNSDNLFLNCIKEFKDTDTPIGTKFFHQYCNHGNNEIIINEDGSINKKSLTYYNLCELYGEDPNTNDYISTYCFFYTNNCYNFLNDVDAICQNIFEKNLDPDLYLPLGDETAFNYLYNKNNFKKFISQFLCYNVPFFLGIESVIENLEKLKKIVCFIHTKRFFNEFNYLNSLELNDEEYIKIIDVLSDPLEKGGSLIFSYHEKNFTDEFEKINFSVDMENPEFLKVKVFSISDPHQESYYNILLQSDINYFIIKKIKFETDDQCMVIYNENKIYECSFLI